MPLPTFRSLALENGVRYNKGAMEIGALIREFKNGERDAFGGIYDLYAERIYRFFFSRTGNK